MAKPEHLEAAKRNWEAARKEFAEAWRRDCAANQWFDLSGVDLAADGLSRTFHGGMGFCWVDFTGAKMRGVKLSKSELWENNFTNADLQEAVFAGSELCYSDFDGANLRGVDFSGADLGGVGFNGADLTGADLTHACMAEANLVGAILDGVKMEGAYLSKATFGFTIVAGADLTAAEGLQTVQHLGPSFLAEDVMRRAMERAPKVFLVGCGVAEEWEYIRGPLRRGLYTLCGDRKWEKQLVRAFRVRGIPAWARPGTAWEAAEWPRAETSISRAGAVVLVIGERLLANRLILEQVEAALQAEEEMRASGRQSQFVFVVASDAHVLDGWDHPLKERLASCDTLVSRDCEQVVQRLMCDIGQAGVL